MTIFSRDFITKQLELAETANQQWFTIDEAGNAQREAVECVRIRFHEAAKLHYADALREIRGLQAEIAIIKDALAEVSKVISNLRH